MSRMITGILVLAMASAAASGVQAQNEPQDAASVKQRMLNAPLKVQLVLVTLRGEKEVSRTPYTLTLVGGGGQGARLRMMTQIPLPTTTTTEGTDGKPATTTQSVQYKDIGTSIDCSSEVTADGSFRLYISINDSSVYAPDGTARTAAGSSVPPTVRSFSSSASVMMKDGGTEQFLVAVDKMTGEIIRAQITLNVQK